MAIARRDVTLLPASATLDSLGTGANLVLSIVFHRFLRGSATPYLAGTDTRNLTSDV